MAKINLLPKNVAELIAAGEVVERPSSVIKELMENSVDAGADKITVEIKNGGVTLMRITDNGCGMYPEDVPTAFLRHATSKIETETDLDEIATLGFRGEALAAVSSVARVELLTKPKEIDMGTRYIIEGGEEILFEEAGCPDGTTISVLDLFYNTPARMKFLKKDVAEGNSVAAIVDRIALSHPEIAIKFIRDGKVVLNTSGNGNLGDTVYAVCGKQFLSEMIEFRGELGGIGVSGMVCKPIACKPTRGGQYIFLNGRFVRSGTVAAALDNAYKGSAMVGKYPEAIIFLTVPYGAVDVNVHPAKTEVRFSDERRIFDAVYALAQNAIAKKDERPTARFTEKKPSTTYIHMTADEYKQGKLPTEAPKPRESFWNGGVMEVAAPRPQAPTTKPIFTVEAKKEYVITESHMPEPQKKDNLSELQINKQSEPIAPKAEEPKVELKIRLVGEAFKTYIIAETEDGIYFIDKHAAHERILYEELKRSVKAEIQYLLTPETVTLSKEDYDAVINATEELFTLGFEIEDFGMGSVIVRAIPSMLIGVNLQSMISELAESLRSKGIAAIDRQDDIYHRIACRAAVKAGNNTTPFEAEALAKRILADKDIMYCPHGRPVAVKMTKRELEKQFGRIQ